MLTYVSNDGKTFEERMGEAITNIPLYTDEWTNFNPSDPGMTILETLTGFETLQEERMADIPVKVRQNLLKMVGFQVRKGRSARLLLSAGNVREPFTLPCNHKFRLGSMVFETNRETKIMDSRIIGVYGYKANAEGDKYTAFPHLTDRETKVPALIFGERPEKDDCLYFISNTLPDPEEEITFFITMRERYNRNPLDGRTEKLFADVVWECYTDKGWEAMDARDNTNAFIMSGEVKLWMPGDYAAVFTEAPIDGYAIRARLVHSEYDVRPKVVAVEAFLFEVWQKNTICECHSDSKTGSIVLHSEIVEDAYVDVFCREGKGESYRKYEYRPDPNEKGRFYRSDHTGFGEVVFNFDKRLRGFGPERGRDCVKFVVYTEDVMRRYALGQVLGYDNQVIDLPYNHIVAHSFCIVARRKIGEELFYDFVRPERNGEGALFYHLLENDGKIIIEEAGRFIGADLFLCSVALTDGPDGNIREGNILISEERGDHLDEGVVYYNPGPGTGGAYREKLESVRQRFIKDMEDPYTAVTEADYERVVLSTPGICLHKARAEMDEERNLVRIAIKQGTDEAFPRLSSMYQKIIKDRIEERRLLTTRVELVQPVYMPVNVTGTVYIKNHYEDAAEAIENTIRNKIDYMNSEKNFGEVLKFDEVFHAVEMLDCVEYVYELSLRPKSLNGAKMIDEDIKPDANCLLYPGQIQIETVTFEN